MFSWLRSLIKRPEPPSVPPLDPEQPQSSAPRSFACKCCGDIHTGLPDVTHRRPDAILLLDANARDSCFENSDGCVIPAGVAGPTAKYFLRGVMEFPFIGDGAAMQERFGFGLWAEVTLEHFESVIECEPGCAASHFQGIVATELPAIEHSTGVPLHIEHREHGQRPFFFVNDPDHELARLQSEG